MNNNTNTRHFIKHLLNTLDNLSPIQCGEQCICMLNGKEHLYYLRSDNRLAWCDFVFIFYFQRISLTHVE